MKLHHAHSPRELVEKFKLPQPTLQRFAEFIDGKTATMAKLVREYSDRHAPIFVAAVPGQRELLAKAGKTIATRGVTPKAWRVHDGLRVMLGIDPCSAPLPSSTKAAVNRWSSADSHQER